MLANSVRRRSMSDLWMAKASTSWSPSLSSPIRSGWNSSSGARKRAGPTLGTQDRGRQASSSSSRSRHHSCPRPGLAWQLTSRVLPSGKVYCTFSVSRASSFCGLMDR